MKVETPQILWNSEGDKGINAALYSISMLESGINYLDGYKSQTHVLATCGNTNVINLWRTNFKDSNNINTDIEANNDVMYHAPSISQQKYHHQQQKKNKKKGNKTNKSNTSSSNANGNANKMNNNKACVTTNFTKIEYICSLSRHEAAVNTIAFSPDGLHIATAGDSGSIIIWSVPVSKRGNNNGRHYWSTITREQDLTVKIIPTAVGSGGVCDISWSADSKRFMAGTIDHSVFVVEDTNYVDVNAVAQTQVAQTQQQQLQNQLGGLQEQHSQNAVALPPPVIQDSNWKIIFRNGMDHTQYVQGVAYDPLGVYLASMSSDRTVRVYSRKTPPKSKKKVLRPTTSNNSSSQTDAAANTSATTAGNASNTIANSTVNHPGLPPVEHQTMVDQLLTDADFEIATKSKQIKYRRLTKITTTTTTTTTSTTAILEDENNNNNKETTTSKRHLYADESTLESFFRRLSWTSDGSFLVTPAALWHHQITSTSTSTTTTTTTTSDNNVTEQQRQKEQRLSSEPSFATCLFARHKFDEPYKIFSGLEKPSVVVRPNPLLFQLPKSAGINNASSNALESKENQFPPSQRTTSLSTNTSAGGLPYRSIFAVLTSDTVLIYDTYHTRPLCLIRGLHYANLVDCCWSCDGLNLVVCSTDGYISFISFQPDELGEIYSPPGTTALVGQHQQQLQQQQQQRASNAANMMISSSPLPLPKSTTIIPPCEPGQSATLEAPPSKRSKKTRITPTLISSTFNSTNTSVATTTNNLNNTKLPLSSSSNSNTSSTAGTIANSTSFCSSSTVKRPVTDTTCTDENMNERDLNKINNVVCVTKELAVNKLTLDSNNAASTTDQQPPSKKKKRIQPTLICAAGGQSTN